MYLRRGTFRYGDFTQRNRIVVLLIFIFGGKGKINPLANVFLSGALRNLEVTYTEYSIDSILGTNHKLLITFM
jgi:hypothetical protein